MHEKHLQNEREKDAVCQRMWKSQVGLVVGVVGRWVALWVCGSAVEQSHRGRRVSLSLPRLRTSAP